MNLPEPAWQSLDRTEQGHGRKPITRAVDLAAKRMVMQSRGRKWTRQHDLLYIKKLVQWGCLPADRLEREREIFQEERAQKKQIRREAGLHDNSGFRIW